MDTFEPEEPIDLDAAIRDLKLATAAADGALDNLMSQLAEFGYAK